VPDDLPHRFPSLGGYGRSARAAVCRARRSGSHRSQF
jgi:hypothetical protein